MKVPPRLKSRKFYIAIILLISMFVFVLMGNMTIDQWAEYAMYIFGIYTVGNVGEHISKDIAMSKEHKEWKEKENKKEQEVMSASSKSDNSDNKSKPQPRYERRS